MYVRVHLYTHIYMYIYIYTHTRGTHYFILTSFTQVNSTGQTMLNLPVIAMRAKYSSLIQGIATNAGAK